MSLPKVSVLDVARYILRSCGEVSAMKLQKLVYYSQAWSVVWDEKPLFKEPIEAWVSGPVVRVLYEAHRGRFLLKPRDLSKGNARLLTADQKETIDLVLDYYGDKNSQWLSDLTHMEKPWLGARKSLAPDERGSREISLASLSEYYSSISLDGQIQ